MNKLCRVFVLVGVLAGLAQPAWADVGKQCVFRLVPLESVGGVTDASLDLVGCFGTYEAALEAGIGQGVDVGAAVTPESLTDEAPDSPTITRMLIGTEYDGSGFAGSSNSYFAPSTCTSSTTWQVANVGAAWNDRFQSGKGFGGCDTNRKFQHENFGGARPDVHAELR